MNDHFTIRHINLTDARATLEVHKPYVENTSITFEYDLPDLPEWESRIKTTTAEYPWVVCEYKNEVIGYAYAVRHRYRTAYLWSPESTIYVSDKFHRLGIARVLYETLFELLRWQGYVNVYAGVTMPNENSENFHRALGFYEVGIFKKIGFKFREWHDTRWFQLHLTEHTADPAKPKPLTEIGTTPELTKIFERANAKLSVLINNENFLRGN